MVEYCCQPTLCRLATALLGQGADKNELLHNAPKDGLKASLASGVRHMSLSLRFKYESFGRI